ncbi:hypothetical protein J3459_018471 [Metarhizium acridum]|nr:hypothetical protein J3459_018471 [Metarhizium acridum]
MARHKLEHDDKWETLAKSIILKDDETPDFVRTPVWCARADEEERSPAGVARLRKSRRRSFSRGRAKDPACAWMLVEAKNRTLAANEAQVLAWRRNEVIVDFVRETTPLLIEKHHAECQMQLLAWAVAQAHSLEAELTGASCSETGSEDGSSNKRRRRRRECDSSMDRCGQSPTLKGAASKPTMTDLER